VCNAAHRANGQSPCPHDSWYDVWYGRRLILTFPCVPVLICLHRCSPPRGRRDDSPRGRRDYSPPRGGRDRSPARRRDDSPRGRRGDSPRRRDDSPRRRDDSPPRR
jgi:hypothetical protein